MTFNYLYNIYSSAYALQLCLKLFDGVQNVCSGVFRGSGLQRVGAMVNLGSYYIVALPAAYLCAFQVKTIKPSNVLNFSELFSS